MSSTSISRRSFVGLAAATVVMNQAARLHGTTPDKRPNILFMLGDDHRADALGCMGNSIIHTPNIDQLAAEGVTFDSHFCTTPICCASRASIMLSQYAGTTGINDFKTPLSAEQVSQTYWQQLKQAGYTIGFIGKFGVGATMPSQAFDYWKGFPGQGFYFPQGPKGPHLSHIIRDQAETFFAQAPRDRPFCLSISFKAPHVQDQAPAQYLPAPEMLELYRDVTIPAPAGAGPDDIRRFPPALQHSESRHRWGVRFSTPELYQASVKGYYRLISGTDSVVGALRATLSKLGLAENTIIVYSADHGIFNGEHGLAGKWYGHEESIRIPLIIHDPRVPRATQGTRRSAMTLNIDLNPTVLELAGLKPAAVAQGRSLVPLLRNEESSPRQVWFIEHHFPDGGWIPSSEGIRTRRWKYLRYTDVAAPFEELYDLDHDRFETNNLAGQPRYRREQRVLTGYWKTWRDSLRQTTGVWHEPVTAADLSRDGLT